MKTNKEKFLALTEKNSANTREKAAERKANREWLREAKRISLEILLRMDELEYKKKDLAAAIEVTPQYISKLLSGNEKYPFDTLCKIQNVLNMPLLHGYKIRKPVKTKTFEYYDNLQIKKLSVDRYKTGKIIKMHAAKFEQEITKPASNGS